MKIRKSHDTRKPLLLPVLFFIITLVTGFTMSCRNADLPEQNNGPVIPRPSGTLPGTPQPPVWLGTRPLQKDAQGTILPVQTPLELQNRRFSLPGPLPPPDSLEFSATYGPVTEEILARSTYIPECPVTPDELSYLTQTYWGFDNRPHTGEMIVHASVATDVIQVFEQLYKARFPLEEMRIITKEDLEAEPTGDGNVTTCFVCRPAVGLNRWSEHAYGLAIDINPFQNPYIRGDLVLPELARSYTNREWIRPGMIFPDDIVVRSFRQIGWYWGGDWESLLDIMHFSLRDR